jgi:lipopolysaccharide/colanic/teichoic acid biosynthesis glycosyltransferase
MMMKKYVLEQIGHFDERFFMYCEDIDLCHRLNKSGLKIYYVPTTQIVHYKGESTKKDKLDYVITFNRSLYKFFQKYYAPSSIFLFRWIVAIGIFLRGIFIYFRNFLRIHFPLVLDTIILNVIIMLSFIIRLELGRGFLWQDYLDQFWIINLIATVLFLAISFYYEIYPNHRFSVQAIMKVNMLTFIFLAFLTFFLKQFAFSRMVVLLTFILSPILMMLWRIFLRRYYRGDKSALGKDLFSKPTLVVGNGKDVNILFKKLKSSKTIDYDLMGWVSLQDETEGENESDGKYLGTLNNLNEIIKFHGIRQIIFSAQSLTYEKILKTMSTFGTSLLEFKMVPSNLDVVIGKSHIEKLDDYPLLDIGYSIGKKYNRFVKRMVDLGISFFLLLFSAPIFIVSYLSHKSDLIKSKIYGYKGQLFDIVTSQEKKGLQIVQNWFLLKHVFLGNLALVGSPIQFVGKPNIKSDYLYKPGITGLIQINRKKISSRDEEEKYHLYYLKNQSLLLDAEIMLKGLFNYLRNLE